MSFCFVGHSRSNRARKMGVRWEDGRLAAKQLFDALRANGINPETCVFVNLFEFNGKASVERFTAERTIVGMGSEVQRELKRMQIAHVALIHPAARGSIRKKERYFAHVREQLRGQLE